MTSIVSANTTAKAEATAVAAATAEAAAATEKAAFVLRNLMTTYLESNNPAPIHYPTLATNYVEHNVTNLTEMSLATTSVSVCLAEERLKIGNTWPSAGNNTAAKKVHFLLHVKKLLAAMDRNRDPTSTTTAPDAVTTIVLGQSKL